MPPTGPTVGLRFWPGRAAVALGVQPNELLDGRVPLGDLWADSIVGNLAEQMAAAQSASQAGALLADGVRRRSVNAAMPDPVGAAAADLLLRSDGRFSVVAIAAHLGLGERQLRARFAPAVGYGPKMFARVVRFRAALDQIRGSNVHLATVAAEAGYADQAHLTRDAGALAGATPGELRAETFKTELVRSET